MIFGTYSSGFPLADIYAQHEMTLNDVAACAPLCHTSTGCNVALYAVKVAHLCALRTSCKHWHLCPGVHDEWKAELWGPLYACSCIQSRKLWRACDGKHAHACTRNEYKPLCIHDPNASVCGPWHHLGYLNLCMSMRTVAQIPGTCLMQCMKCTHFQLQALAPLYSDASVLEYDGAKCKGRQAIMAQL
eukprot:1159427-Pelagomonas_calceolata.AAC.7